MRQFNHSSRFIAHFLGSSYTKKRLGDVCNVFSGKTVDLAKENEGGPIAYLKVADLSLPENDRVITTSSRFVSEQTAKASGLVPIGATIFPKNGAAALHNKKRITSVITCVDMNTMAVYSTSDTVIPEYLYGYLESQDLAALTLVGAIPQIRAKDVQSLTIPVPSVREQEQYVAIMHQADKSKFSDFKSRFIEMFGHPNSNPLGIPTGLVSDSFTLQMGKTPARDIARYWAKDGSGHKWISIADMSQYEYFTEDTEEYISDSAIQEAGMKLIPEKTVIMSFKLTIGRVSVTSEPIFSNEAIVAFIPRTQDYNTRFLYYLVKFYDWLENAALAVKGKTLNKESIGKNRLIIPSIESQNEFASLAEQADKSKYLN